MDQSLFFLINGRWAARSLDLPMAALSSWAFWWPPALAVGLLLLVLGGFRGRAALLCIGLSVGLSDGIVARNLKAMVGRPRPNQVLEGVRMIDLQKTRPRQLAILEPAKVAYSKPSIQPVRGVSFPSSHASNNFAVAVVLALFYRRWGWLYFVPAALVAYSRVYVGSHYPSDIVVASVIGSGLACLVVAACEALWRRFGGRVTPRLFAAHPSLLPS